LLVQTHFLKVTPAAAVFTICSAIPLLLPLSSHLPSKPVHAQGTCGMP